jgi:hypothetical protein
MANNAPRHQRKQTMAAMPRVAAILATLSLSLSAPAFAEEIPPCALTGSMTVMIGGKPALRLSDVAKCPPALYDIITSVQIDGQPMVHFKTGSTGKVRCFSEPNPTVTVESKQASTLGDTACAEIK